MWSLLIRATRASTATLALCIQVRMYESTKIVFNRRIIPGHVQERSRQIDSSPIPHGKKRIREDERCSPRGRLAHPY